MIKMFITEQFPEASISVDEGLPACHSAAAFSALCVLSSVHQRLHCWAKEAHDKWWILAAK